MYIYVYIYTYNTPIFRHTAPFHRACFGPEYHCTSDAPCWNNHGSLSLQGFLPKRRPIPKTGTAYIGNQPGREMLNKGMKTFC